jgi:spectinomycin phosphotransferase/16S rRNA (guanine(1405)-N(7))-methyltransferase
VRRDAGRFALALYPYVEGQSHSWSEYGSLSDRLAVLKLIVALHGTPPGACKAMRVEDFCVPNRDELFRAIDDVAGSWDSGPYAEEARSLLSRHADGVERLLARYDRLAHDARQRPEHMVVSHGEPHVGNVIVTGDGWVLIDWDTVLLAPPERDLWMLASGERSVIDAYERATARTVMSSMLDLYRLRWDVAEIAIYIAELRRPHRRSADTDAAWTNLHATLTRLATDTR